MSATPLVLKIRLLPPFHLQVVGLLEHRLLCFVSLFWDMWICINSNCLISPLICLKNNNKFSFLQAQILLTCLMINIASPFMINLVRTLLMQDFGPKFKVEYSASLSDWTPRRTLPSHATNSFCEFRCTIKKQCECILKW